MEAGESNLERSLVRKITGKAASELPDVTTLSASSQGLRQVQSLSFLSALQRLDLSNNHLEDIGAIASCTTLRWLNLSGNKLKDISELAPLTQLQVLNVGHNQLTGKINFTGLPALGAFIANDNAFTLIKGLGDSKALNTVVLKSNRLSSLGRALQKHPALAKLSLAHNQISDVGDSLKGCLQLAELRIGHNELQALSEEVQYNSRLKLVDLGSNPLESWGDVKVLKKLPKLQNLTLKGCPFAVSKGYLASMKSNLPHLQILDNTRHVTGKSDQSKRLGEKPEMPLQPQLQGQKRKRPGKAEAEDSKRIRLKDKSRQRHAYEEDVILEMKVETQRKRRPMALESEHIVHPEPEEESQPGLTAHPKARSVLLGQMQSMPDQTPSKSSGRICTGVRKGKQGEASDKPIDDTIALGEAKLEDREKGYHPLVPKDKRRKLLRSRDEALGDKGRPAGLPNASKAHRACRKGQKGTELGNNRGPTKLWKGAQVAELLQVNGLSSAIDEAGNLAPSW